MTIIAGLVAPNAQARLIEDGKPIVIAHRGASGYLPEHTLGAYELGITQGADYIEPDLVLTKDGHLVARHDVYLSTTTDVAKRAEFADRRRSYGGRDDWFVFDFTLAELKALRAVQPRQSRGTDFDGQEQVPTLDEIIDLVVARAGDGKTGLYIEMKHPAAFEAQGLDPTAPLLAAFSRIRKAGIPVYFQCFDGDYLMQFADQTDVPLVWLDGGKKNEESGAFEMELPLSHYPGIAGVGLYKALLLDADGRSNGIVERAHNLGLKVHVWTVRDDDVPANFPDASAELRLIWSMGVDGVFTDFPNTAVKSRDAFMLTREPAPAD